MNHDNTQARRVALVTGSSRRIGAAIVTQLHQSGFHVLIHCHTHLHEAQQLSSKLSQIATKRTLVVQCDLTQQASCTQLIEQAIDWAGQLDLLVNNASIFTPTNLASFNEKDWDDLFSIHVKVPFWLSTAANPHLQTTQGCIINMTDIHAEKPLKGYSVYSQSKAALAMQTKALAREFAPKVRVNSIAPGATLWPENSNALNMEQKNNIIQKTTLKRAGDPAYIAQAVMALVENPFITGETLHVDGGRLS